jgi:DNA repair exonuclease SbcCD ATPase subunit
LEEKLGLNYRSFVNVVVFTDNKLGCFLECDKQAKAEIVENLFSVDKCRAFADTAKTFRNEFKGKIKKITEEYEGLLSQLADCKNREKQIQQEENAWIVAKNDEIEKLAGERDEAIKKLEWSAEGELLGIYQDAQDRIKEINVAIPDLESKKATLQEAYDIAKSKLDQTKQNKHKLKLEKQDLENAVKKSQLEIGIKRNKIEAIESQKGARCDKCYAVVSEENYGTFVQQSQNEIDHFTGLLEKQLASEKEVANKISKVDGAIAQIDEALKIAQKKLTQIANKVKSYNDELIELKEIEKPEMDLHHAVLKEQIDSLNERIKARLKELEGETPHAKIKQSAKEETAEKQDECEQKKKDLDEAVKELPYYEFWVKAFGESGIRKFVIDSIVPALNARIAHWMEILIDGKVKLTFDNELDEMIERNPADGDPYVYPQMSGGEKQRLNLAVSQGFAHVLMLSSGASPSLIFLDEVATNMDRIGVVGIYNMILELAKTRQVFVTSHDRDLLEMLNGCEKLKLEKKDGFTTIVS